jgi:hypothetical protein
MWVPRDNIPSEDYDLISYPTGMLRYFTNSQGGYYCPYITDHRRFSPINITTRVFDPDTGIPWDLTHDNDFTLDPNDNGELFNALFWHKQQSKETETWLVLLGCGTLSDINVFGYTPLEAWNDLILTEEDGCFVNTICGYSSYGPTAGGSGESETLYSLINAIGSKFSEIIVLDEPMYDEYYYLCQPPDTYSYRPVRAWMEAHCWALREYPNLDKAIDIDSVSSAKVIAGHYMWYIDTYKNKYYIYGKAI